MLHCDCFRVCFFFTLSLTCKFREGYIFSNFNKLVYRSPGASLVRFCVFSTRLFLQTGLWRNNQGSDGRPGEMSSLHPPLSAKERAREQTVQVIKCQENNRDWGSGIPGKTNCYLQMLFALSDCLTEAAGEFY